MGLGNSMSEGVDEAAIILRSSRMKREVQRLRASASWRIGLHLTSAVRNPLRLLLLPLSFPAYCIYLVLERLGKIAAPVREEVIGEEIEEIPNTRNCIVLFPTNGVGFGHFTRLYALAKRLRKLDDSLEIVFFTPMPTLHIPYSDEFPTYHLAGRYKHKNMETSTWNMLVEEMLTLVFEVHKPRCFIFDGAFPYRGMLNSINQRKSLNKVWLRRGMFKKGSSVPVDSISFFDTVVHPKDAVERSESEIIHSIKTETVSPITLIDNEEMLERNIVRSRLGLPLDCKVTYVQLGAGKINQIDSDIRIVVETLLKNKDMYVVIGESMLGKRVDIDLERIRVVRDYPNAIYFKGFDYSVQAGGYNSFHEMRRMQLPTLFIPNLNTGMDDQLARCLVAKEEGWGEVLKSVTHENVDEALLKIMGKIPAPILESNGANELAEMIIEERI